jgi:hypothetical protein
LRPYLEKSLHKEGLVEWLKVKALSSNPSTAKKKRRDRPATRSHREPQHCPSLHGPHSLLKSTQEARL